MKFLLLLIVIGVVYWLFKSYKRKARREAQAPAGSEDMVRCAQCGLHLPRSESLPAGTSFYCSAEHRRQSEPSD